jgi:hypothetical protein
VLDVMIERIRVANKPDSWSRRSELEAVIYELAVKALSQVNPSAARLWSWLRLLRGERQYSSIPDVLGFFGPLIPRKRHRSGGVVTIAL